jgi:hypothetical protein
LSREVEESRSSWLAATPQAHTTSPRSLHANTGTNATCLVKNGNSSQHDIRLRPFHCAGNAQRLSSMYFSWPEASRCHCLLHATTGVQTIVQMMHGAWIVGQNNRDPMHGLRASRPLLHATISITKKMLTPSARCLGILHVLLRYRTSSCAARGLIFEGYASRAFLYSFDEDKQTASGCLLLDMTIERVGEVQW